MSPFSPKGARKSPPKPACAQKAPTPGWASARRAGCPAPRLCGFTSNQLGAAVSSRGTRRAEALLRQIRSVPETCPVSSWVEPSMDWRSSHCRYPGSARGSRDALPVGCSRRRDVAVPLCFVQAARHRPTTRAATSTASRGNRATSPAVSGMGRLRIFRNGWARIVATIRPLPRFPRPWPCSTAHPFHQGSGPKNQDSSRGRFLPCGQSV